MKKLFAVSLVLLLMTFVSSFSFAQSAAKPAPTVPAFIMPGTIELGGELSYASQKVEDAEGSASLFSMNPYVGIMVGSGFELGFKPGVQFQKAGDYKATTFNLLFAPAFNINGGGSVFSYFEFLVGYNMMSYEETIPYYGHFEQTASGAAIGVDGGFKAIIGNSGLVLFKIEYLHQTFKSDGQFASEVSYNTLSAGIGFRVFFGNAKTK
jgi:hypothetical protein